MWQNAGDNLLSELAFLFIYSYVCSFVPSSFNCLFVYLFFYLFIYVSFVFAAQNEKVKSIKSQNGGWQREVY